MTLTAPGRMRIPVASVCWKTGRGRASFTLVPIYADKLPWASAIACYGGGVFVVAGPDIIYLKDTMTNGIADLRNVVFTGLGSTNPVDMLVPPNNLTWGMDNRVHGASAGVPALLPLSSGPDAAMASLTSADFSFDPRSLTICAEAGPGQSGLSFDNWGRKFTCDFRRPLRTPRYEPRYLARNPFFPPPPRMQEVASPATRIFEHPVPLARSAPTTNSASALAPGATVPTTTWLTNAQGCVVYRGGAFGSNYLGNVFVADPSAHVIHRFVLREAGLDVTAARALDETNAEFVASPDPHFRPVQIVNGPDGALYVADRQDARDHGRVYRLAPTSSSRPNPRSSARRQPTSWWQCYHTQTAGSVTPPPGCFTSGATQRPCSRWQACSLILAVPWARLHALQALDGLGALNSR